MNLNDTKLFIKNSLINIGKNKHSFIFIIINIVVAFLGFSRSFIFMKALDFEQLGLITILQTAAMLVAFLQLGLINGGYRIVAVQNNERIVKRTVNTIFSYLLVLTVLLLICTVFIHQIKLINTIDYSLLVVFLSISTLLSVWLTNFLIAQHQYHYLNKVNLLSALIGAASVVLVFYYGVFGAIISLIIQPIVFISLVLIKHKDCRPNKFELKYKIMRYILRFGFIPFLSGLFFLSYIQVERWGISMYIGTAALGQAYLYFMIVALWVLVPTSIMNLFFPRAAKSFSENDLVSMNKIVSTHFYVIMLYCLLGSIAIYFLLAPLVKFAFEQHLPFVDLVIISLPGLIFRSLADPIAVFLNSIVKLKPIFWSDVISLICYVLGLGYVISTYKYDLLYAVYLFDLYFIIRFLIVLGVYLNFSKKKVFLESD